MCYNIATKLKGEKYQSINEDIKNEMSGLYDENEHFKDGTGRVDDSEGEEEYSEENGEGEEGEETETVIIGGKNRRKVVTVVMRVLAIVEEGALILLPLLH